MKVKNISQTDLRIAGFSAFSPEEVREVSAEESEVLLKNPNIEIVKGKEKEITAQEKK